MTAAGGMVPILCWDPIPKQQFALFLIGFLQELLLRDKYPTNWSTPYNPNRSANYSAIKEEEKKKDEFCEDDGPEEE